MRNCMANPMSPLILIRPDIAAAGPLSRAQLLFRRIRAMIISFPWISMRVRVLYHDHCFDGAASAAYFGALAPAVRVGRCAASAIAPASSLATQP